jgi:hypothetical protein
LKVQDRELETGDVGLSLGSRFKIRKGALGVVLDARGACPEFDDLLPLMSVGCVSDRHSTLEP